MIGDYKRAKNLLHNLFEYYPFDPFKSYSGLFSEEERINNFWNNQIIIPFNKSGFKHLVGVQNAKEFRFSSNREFAQYYGTKIKLELGFFSRNSKNIESLEFSRLFLKLFVKYLSVPEEQYTNWDLFMDASEKNRDIYKQRFGASHYAGNTCNILSVEEFCNQINQIFKIFFGKFILRLLPNGDLVYNEQTVESQQEIQVFFKMQDLGMPALEHELKEIIRNRSNHNYPDAIYHIRKAGENFIKDLLHRAGILDHTDSHGKIAKIKNENLGIVVDILRKNIPTVFDLDSKSKDEESLNHYLITFKNLISDSNSECHGHGSNEFQKKNIKDQDFLCTRLYNFLINGILFLSSYMNNSQ